MYACMELSRLLEMIQPAEGGLTKEIVKRLTSE